MDLEKKGFQKGLIVFGILLGVLVLLGTLVSYFVIDIVEKETGTDIPVAGETPNIQFILAEDTDVTLLEGESYTFDVVFNYPGGTDISALQYDLIFEGGVIQSAQTQNLDFKFGFCSPVEGLSANQLPPIFFGNQLCLVGASNGTFTNNTTIASVVVKYDNDGVFPIKLGPDNNLFDSVRNIVIPSVGGTKIGQVTVEAAPFCGDGTVDTGEVCDTGAFNGTVCTPEYAQTCSYCSSDCSAEIQVNAQTFCGDNIVNGDEECDDANTNNLDSCSNSCVTAICGDGIVNGADECDDSNTVDDDSCSNTCTINQVEADPVCGNGILEAGEECDDPNNPECSSSCTVNPAIAIKCYSCTISESDGNNCQETEVISYSGVAPTCPTGSSNNSNCAELTGGSCPVSANPGGTDITCGPIDVNDDKQITLTDFVSFVQYFGKNCTDTQVPASATTCGSKDQRDPIGNIGLSDLVYFANKFNRGANSCLAQ